jgi:hypothetical protein
VSSPSLARKQLYFFDACKTPLDNTRDRRTSPLWDPPMVQTEDRHFVIFSATASGRPAYGAPGHPVDGKEHGHSLFCEALLRCLNGKAAILDRQNDPRSWRMTISSLQIGLAYHLKKVASEVGTDQPLEDHRVGKDFSLCTFAEIPDVDLEIFIDPGRATNCARLCFSNLKRETVNQVEPPLASNPHIISIQAGHYIVKAADCGNHREFIDPEEILIAALPPGTAVGLNYLPS